MLAISLLFLFVGSALSNRCPSSFELVRNGECYSRLGDGINMYAPNGPSEVKSDCADYNALPVIIKNQEDNDYWVNVAKNDHKYGNAYGYILLGIECNADNYWQWSDGTHVNYRPDEFDQELVERCNDNGQYCMWAINPVTGRWMKACNSWLSVDIYCTIVPDIQPVESDSDCADFRRPDWDDECFQVGATAVNISEATTICASFGGSVASVHEEDQNKFIRRLAVSHGLVNGLMLGGMSTGKNNKFKWMDGSSWDYDNFAPGFPIGGFGDCLAMDTNNVGGQWINVDCSLELPYACIRGQGDPEPTCDGTLRNEGDIIFSPGFPSSATEPCDFLLKVPTGMLVEVEILFLEANSCCDHLILFEGPLGNNVIADLSGEQNSGRTFRTSSQNVMRASWQPNGAVNVKGMLITFRSVSK